MSPSLNSNKEICIIGGGASGLYLAKLLGERGLHVTILERLPRVGKKLLVTGNGRCNFTNQNLTQGYDGVSESVMKCITSFSCVDAFEQMGILPFCDEAGRYYPYSNQATTVADTLRGLCENYGVELICDCMVKRVTAESRGGFQIETSQGILQSTIVIFATGGMASPSCGTDGTGLQILKKMGLPITKLRPALVSLCCGDKDLKALKGVRVKGKVSLNGYEEQGEIQFNETSLSGICVMNLSRYAEQYPVTLYVDFFPQYSKKEVTDRLYQSMSLWRKNCHMEQFGGMMHKKLIPFLLKRAGIIPSETGALSHEQVKNLAFLLKKCPFQIIGAGDWSQAQVTRGGVKTDALTEHFESKAYHNLYVIGEAVDVDGFCGGYNLHWAWCSANACAENILRRYKK